MTTKIKSNPRYDRARDILIRHYFPIINEAIEAEGNGLHPINPDDFIIVSGQEMEIVAQQDFGKLHPEISDVLEDACRQKGLKLNIEMVNDSINGMTIGHGYKSIVLNGRMEYIGSLSRGEDWRGACQFIPLMTHEAGHYSVTGRQYGSDSALVEAIKGIRIPFFNISGNEFTKLEYEDLLERARNIIRSMQGVSMDVEGARILIKGLGKDVQEYKIGSMGYNFTETLTDWVTERIRKRAIDNFVNKNRDLSAKVVRGWMTSFPTKSEMFGLTTYSVDSVKRELNALGLSDITSMRRAFLSSEIPKLYFESHATANAYFS